MKEKHFKIEGTEFTTRPIKEKKDWPVWAGYIVKEKKDWPVWAGYIVITLATILFTYGLWIATNNLPQ